MIPRHTMLIWTLLLFLGLNVSASADQTIKMSTTTSTQASGLLDILLPAFRADTGITVHAIAKGTGAAIRDGEDGNVDIIFVHARKLEDAFIAHGFGSKRYGIMHNDFVILGPPTDPAAVRGCGSAAAAFKKIADSKSTFISRGDDSGTHSKEQNLWQQTELDLSEGNGTIIKKGGKKEIKFLQPLGNWYLSIGQGMGKALTFADEKQAYILADRGTYIKYKYGRDIPIALEVLCEGDKELSNPYGVIPINPAKHPHVKHELADKFAQWLVSARGQKLIAGYRLLDQQLFYPDAL